MVNMPAGVAVDGENGSCYELRGCAEGHVVRVWLFNPRSQDRARGMKQLLDSIRGNLWKPADSYSSSRVMRFIGIGLCCAVLLSGCMLLGCRARAPIHVWTPGEVLAPRYAKVALAPMTGQRELARQIEQEILLQRPAARADVAIVTAEQLAQRSPVQLASTAALSSDLTAIKSAQAVGADILLHGQILAAHLEPLDEQVSALVPEQVNMNQAFFHRRDKKELRNESLLLSWRVVDVETGSTLGTKVFNLQTAEALDRYPDLATVFEDDRELLIAASARETWTVIAPVVIKDQVRLAVPWLQPGAWTVRRGVRAAKRGQWETAEAQWKRIVDRFPFNASAQHNLALAMAAREDFPAAKQQILKAQGPLAFRLPGETLFWLDLHHRKYHAAHGLPKPPTGWAFPDPEASPVIVAAPPVDVQDLPWWTAVPFAKPPQWSWQDWFSQPFSY